MLFNVALIELLHTNIVLMLDSLQDIFTFSTQIPDSIKGKNVSRKKHILVFSNTNGDSILFVSLQKQNLTDLINACATISAHGVQYIV